MAYNNTLKMGILPVALFASGHTFFTQKMFQTLNLQVCTCGGVGGGAGMERVCKKFHGKVVLGTCQQSVQHGAALAPLPSKSPPNFQDLQGRAAAGLFRGMLLPSLSFCSCDCCAGCAAFSLCFVRPVACLSKELLGLSHASLELPLLFCLICGPSSPLVFSQTLCMLRSSLSSNPDKHLSWLHTHTNRTLPALYPLCSAIRCACYLPVQRHPGQAPPHA